MISNSRTVEIGTLTLRPDGILHVIVDFTGAPTEEAAASYLAARTELVGSAMPPVLLQLVNVPFVERAIRTFFVANVGSAPCRAVVSVDPTFITMWRSFEIVDEAQIPTEVFSTLDQAIDWIRKVMVET